MKTNGYVIARNRKVDQFFTSSSAYDRPKWIPVTEATVYPTPEMAQAAAVKLAKNGAYECRIVSIQEALPPMNLPLASVQGSQDQLPPGDLPPEDGMEVDIQPDGEGNTEMVAADQEQPCEQCEHCPCTCDDDSDMIDDETGDVDSIVDDELGLDGVEGDGMPLPGDPNGEHRTTAAGEEIAQRLSQGRGGLGESTAEAENKIHLYHLVKGDRMGGPEHKLIKSFPDRDAARAHAKTLPKPKNKMHSYVLRTTHPKSVNEAVLPARPAADPVTPGNKATVHDVKGAEVIKYKDPANKPGEPDPTIAGSHEEKVKVPSEVMSELSKAIAEFKQCAEVSNTRDDSRASFCMTVASAFEQLLDDLKLGTVEGVKTAQIHMTSWMNPITAHLPVSVQKFVMMGGRKPTLKDMFDDKRAAKKEQL